jgi:hypothetical protein
LWLEFDAPPQDKNDVYFVRVENYGPDPLLISFPSDLPSAQDAKIALDPEPIRTITPDSTNDDAGLAAMTQLIPSASSPVHFLVPLPGGISPAALDLFGFWTYELRCGHLQWSTAQARFGRPLRIAGVQHPCPPLTASVERVKTIPTGGGPAQPCIACTAELAQTVLNNVSLTSAFRPQTQIWFLLYAQLLRADGEVHRNLLLAKLQGAPPDPAGAFAPPQHGIPVNAAFPEAGIDNILATLRLPVNSPLSVLAVELFNSESLVVQQDNVKAVIDGHGELLSETGRGTQAQAPQSSAVTTAGSTGFAAQASQRTQVLPDPLGNELGMQRILRVSPLTPVRQVC